MTSTLTNKLTRKWVTGHAKQFEPQDPLYEYYTSSSGKRKRRKRRLPAGLTKNQAKLLQKIQKRAHYLDKGFVICGFRFGWTFFIGLVPGLGDATDALLNYTLVLKPIRKKQEEEQIPTWLISKMLFNNMVSAGIGLVPLIGDVGLAVWKANSRNAKLLEEFFRVKGEENIQAGLQNLTPSHPSQAAVQQHGSSPSSSSSAAPATGPNETSISDTLPSNQHDTNSNRKKKFFWSKS